MSNADLNSPSDLAATGGRHFGGSQLKMRAPAGVSRIFMPLAAADGAIHNAAKYWRPGHRPDVGVIVMHPAADFLQHYALGPLAQAGYLALGVNSRFTHESNAILEQAVLDMASAVRYLRDEGCRRVVLLGNSGGGGLACFYQAEAENPTVRATPAGDPPDLTAADLPPADAVILLNAHRGRAQVLTGHLDPSVVDEQDPVRTDPELDMFDARNGPPYPPEFVHRYKAAQVARNDRITDWAVHRLEELSRLGYADQAFVVHRTTAALESADLGLDPSDRPSGWYGGADTQWFNRAAVGLGRFATLRSWLSQWGLKTSNALAEACLARTTAPLLVLQSTSDQGVFPADAAALHAAGGTADKTLRLIKGGTHFFAGQPEVQADVIAMVTQWLAQRNMAGGGNP